MRKIINWKLFFVLVISCVITGEMALPYVLSLLTKPIPVALPVFLLATLVQTAVIFSIVTFIGLYLAGKVGFGLPIVEAYLKGEKVGDKLKSILGISIALGVLAGVLIVILSIPFGAMSLDFLRTEVAVPTWKTIMVSFYGGIAEEVLLRLFLMTVLVWITFKIKRTTDNKPTVIGVWLAIIISSVLFGLGHLPITGEIMAITPLVVLRAIVLNGVGGVIFGWLYWKKGLESAMISHFTADIVLHVITPLIASLFV